MTWLAGPMKCVKDCFTERDNQTIDLKRLLWAAGTLWFMAQDSFAVLWKGQAFDPQATGIGLTGIITAGGAAVLMGARSENSASGASGDGP